MRLARGPITVGIDASCWLNRRGFGRYTRELIGAMLRSDHDNTYVLFLDAATARESNDLPDIERARRVIVGTGAAAARAASAAGRRTIRDLWAMRRAVAQHRDLDVFYFPSLYTYFPIKTRAKVVVTKHDMTDRRFPNLLFANRRRRFFWQVKVRWAMRRADLIVTVSETSKRDIREAFRLPDTAVRIVPDAVDPTFRPVDDPIDTEQVVQRYGLSTGERFLLYVGGISPHKNLSVLIEAYGAVARSRPEEDLKLVLVGDFERDVFHSSYPALRELIGILDLGERVVFTGFVPDADLVHLYNASAALVLPSLWEGFGLPALEAMACGVPVIASRAGALPEVVGEAGLFFDPSSPDELAACITRLLGDRALAEQLGGTGRARASEFHWEASARAARAVLEEVVRS